MAHDHRGLSSMKPLRPKRKLTPFLCQELLYEYAVGTLDPLRQADVDEYLPTDRASQDALGEIRRGLEYSDRLASTELSPELSAKLSQAENFRTLARRSFEWDQWPETLRWSVSALALSAFVAGVVTVVPWNQLPSFPKRQDSNTVILADIPNATVLGENSEEGEESEVPTAGAEGSPELETSGDEHITGDEPAAVIAESPALRDSVGGSPIVQATPAPASAPSPVANTPVPPTGTKKTTEAGTSVAAAEPEGKPKGFVYRAFINVTSVDEVTPELVKQLEGMGGEKAGEVPLGWRKGSGSYFHFTVPVANEEKVTDILRAYGPVRISKDPHPRVMPSGQVRFILWVEPQASGSQ